MARFKAGVRGGDVAILLVGIGWLVFLLTLSKPPVISTYFDVERDAGYMLWHGTYSDLTQDVIGFRAICQNTNAYPILGPAMAKLGVFWDIKHVSTHPPTAFLLVSPVAWMPIDSGARIWAWLMVACIAGSFFCLGCSPVQSIALTLIGLAWPPEARSLGQLTAIWLLGVCAAFRYLSKLPMISGALLGVATATKMAPVLFLAFIWHRPKALMGFAAVGIILLMVLLWRCPSSINIYMHSARTEVRLQYGRPDNGSLLGRASRSYGRPGEAVALLFLGVVFAVNWRQVARGSMEGWSVMSYLAVAALPILWVYSVAPLLFLGRWALLGGWMRRLFFCTFVLATTVLPVWTSARILMGTVIWLGIGFIIIGWNERRQLAA